VSRCELLCFALLFSVLPTLRAEKIDNRNFAIDTCCPAPNEIRLAEERARAYWKKNSARFGSNPVYLAVVTSKVFPSEVQLLWQKLINSETTASFFGQRRGGYSNLQLKGVMIFDTRTAASWAVAGISPSIRRRLGVLPVLTTTSPVTSDLVIGVEDGTGV